MHSLGIAQILQIYQIYKDAIDLTSRFFKMKFKECSISLCWSYTLSIILVGFTALQTSGLVKKQKNQICSYNNNYVTKD